MISPELVEKTVEATKKLGPITIIALVLVWLIAYRIDNAVASISETMRIHTADTSYVFKELNKTNSILRQVCINTAETTTDRNACFQ